MMNNVNISSTAEQRRRMIETAAYYRAEKRGFTAGDAVKDWVEAEREIDVLFQSALPYPDAARQQAADAVSKMSRRGDDLSKRVPGFLENWKGRGSRFLNEARTAVEAWLDRH
jgi:hypothetical protein